jgi:hypothetical protein
MKKTSIRFNEGALKQYQKLQESVINGKISKKKPTYEQLLKSINKVLYKIKNNPNCGDLIPRKYLTKATINKYNTDKIFRIELIGYWRLLYTLVQGELKILAFILDFMDHKDYNKLLGYKKK